MENRRQHYRHPFGREQSLAVQFVSSDEAAAFEGTIVNLSIGGMCAVSEALAKAADGPWTALFALDGRPMRMPVERVYRVGERPGQCGFHFVPPADAARREEQEQTIWKFLLTRQRQERKQAREGGRISA